MLVRRRLDMRCSVALLDAENPFEFPPFRISGVLEAAVHYRMMREGRWFRLIVSEVTG